MWNFFIGFLVGVISTVGITIVLVYHYLSDEKNAEGKSHLEGRMTENGLAEDPEKVKKRMEEVFQDREMKLFFSDVNFGTEEKCEWFNLILQRIFMEYAASSLEEKYRNRLIAKFAKAKDKPQFVGEINVSNLNFGNFTPKIQPIKLIPPMKPMEIRAEFDLIYNGGFKITIETELWWKIPTRNKPVSLPICLTVTLEHLSGKVLFVCPPGPDPVCTMQFYNDPISKFSVVPLLGDKKKVKTFPVLSRFIISHLQRSIRKDLVYPNGICFHIPLKATLSTGREMNITTIRHARMQSQTRKPEDKEVETNVLPSEDIGLSKETPVVENDNRDLSKKNEKKMKFGTRMKDKVIEVRKKMQEESKYIYHDKYKDIKKQREEEKTLKEVQSMTEHPKFAEEEEEVVPVSSQSLENWRNGSLNYFNLSWEERAALDEKIGIKSKVETEKNTAEADFSSPELSRSYKKDEGENSSTDQSSIVQDEKRRYTRDLLQKYDPLTIFKLEEEEDIRPSSSNDLSEQSIVHREDQIMQKNSSPEKKILEPIPSFNDKIEQNDALVNEPIAEKEALKEEPSATNKEDTPQQITDTILKTELPETSKNTEDHLIQNEITIADEAREVEESHLFKSPHRRNSFSTTFGFSEIQETDSFPLSKSLDSPLASFRFKNIKQENRGSTSAPLFLHPLAENFDEEFQEEKKSEINMEDKANFTNAEEHCVTNTEYKQQSSNHLEEQYAFESQGIDAKQQTFMETKEEDTRNTFESNDLISNPLMQNLDNRQDDADNLVPKMDQKEGLAEIVHTQKHPKKDSEEDPLSLFAPIGGKKKKKKQTNDTVFPFSLQQN